MAEAELDLNKVFDEFFEKYKDSKSVEVYEEQLEGWFKLIDELREENKKLKETIKEHKLYEEKLEHRIIEFEELLHGE